MAEMYAVPMSKHDKRNAIYFPCGHSRALWVAANAWTIVNFKCTNGAMISAIRKTTELNLIPPNWIEKKTKINGFIGVIDMRINTRNAPIKVKWSLQWRKSRAISILRFAVDKGRGEMWLLTSAHSCKMWIPESFHHSSQISNCYLAVTKSICNLFTCIHLFILQTFQCLLKQQ